ncbi:globin family protein [Roseiarcaceae bacterium H3SJ34-1]|uniref:globin family protein n=1 Tax=Terripilifer ovatus TaxID=3032367 RepID=UPI003AB9A854|nr:globin family protein [Roseiarcaceae bacterium H3SJ34-1]
MQPAQIDLVKSSFAKVVPISEAAAALFYERLFTLDPSLRSLFKGDMAEQGRKLMAMLATVITNLHRLDELTPAVRDLARRHTGYGVQDQHYDTVGAALIWTLEQGLGPDFTDETRASWLACYTILAGEMKSVAA